jgi:hypothetical protein
MNEKAVSQVPEACPLLGGTASDEARALAIYRKAFSEGIDKYLAGRAVKRYFDPIRDPASRFGFVPHAVS